MIRFQSKGDFSKVSEYLERMKKSARRSILEKYAKEGVKALSEATPVDTGKTAASWYYRIENQNGSYKIVWLNSNTNNGIPIAILLQYGHGTGTGGWVEGRDYINPAIQPIFEKIAKDAWEEVRNV